MARLSPAELKTLFAKARTAQEAGRIGAARKDYLKILKSRPDLPEVHFNLAEIAANEGRVKEAAASYEAALKLRPRERAIWFGFLTLASQMPDMKNLRILLKRAGDILEGSGEKIFFEALIAISDGDIAKAEAGFNLAEEAGFASVRLFLERASIRRKDGRDESALEDVNKALSLEPENPEALARRAEILRIMGRRDEAIAAAEDAIKFAPDVASNYHTLSSLVTFSEGDPRVVAMERKLAAKKSDKLGSIFLHHALAKAAADMGKPDDVMAHLHKANAAKRALFPYGHAADVDLIRQYRETYEAIAEAKIEDTTDYAPIFVTGLPRSGTTLVEQILAAHSSVRSGGELAILMPMIGTAMKRPAALSVGLAKAGHNYAIALKDRFGSAIVTDKSISTFVNLGIAALAMPKARFIVMDRRPADTALSIYRNFFEPGRHRYSASLKDIAAYMKLFETQMAYWTEQCPDRFHIQSYEGLVTSPEAETRALLAAAGLEWEDQCLTFHEKAGRVATLSSEQVRQPLYRSSDGGWKKFEADLAPFLSAYGDGATSTLAER